MTDIITAQMRYQKLQDRAEKMGLIRRTLCALGALLCGALTLGMGQVFLIPALTGAGTFVAGIATLALAIGTWRLCTLAWNGK